VGGSIGGLVGALVLLILLGDLPFLGDLVGALVGAFVLLPFLRDLVGDTVGDTVGDLVGLNVGAAVGAAVGAMVGAAVVLGMEGAGVVSGAVVVVSELVDEVSVNVSPGVGASDGDSLIAKRTVGTVRPAAANDAEMVPVSTASSKDCLMARVSFSVIHWMKTSQQVETEVGSSHSMDVAITSTSSTNCNFLRSPSTINEKATIRKSDSTSSWRVLAGYSAKQLVAAISVDNG